MSTGKMLRSARVRAGLTQRALAERAKVPQATIARIESGAADPRVGTLSKILRACQAELRIGDQRGIGIDRTVINILLDMTPAERFIYMVASSRSTEKMMSSMKKL